MDKPNPKKWTKKEETYLKNWYGRKSIKEIACDLKRSYDSVQGKIERLGLSKCTEYSGEITAYQFAKLINVDPHTVLLWIEKRKLPHKRKVLAHKREFILIDIAEFWKWAKENQSLINFSKIEKYILIPEPNWVDEARKKDYHAIPKRRQQLWTPEEDELICYLYYKKGYTQEKVAQEVKRSKSGVNKRLSFLSKRVLKRDNLASQK